MDHSKSINVIKMALRNAQIFLFATIILSLFASCKSEFSIENPYEKVNWEEYGRYKTDLHVHTSVSDGAFSPHVVVDRYHDLGYDILALADHNVSTYPWEEFSSFEPSIIAYRWLNEGRLDGFPHEDSFVYENRDPDALGMIAIQANEISQHHHMGSYFSNVGHYDEIVGSYHSNHDKSTTTVRESLEAIAKKNGLAVLFHPGAYRKPVEWYVDIFQRHDCLIGMEAYSGGLNHQPGNIYKWDSTLIQLMPDRMVWGFANDDYHGVGNYKVMGTTWNVFLLPELSVEEVRKGMENGLSYFVYAPEGHDGPPAPEIISIEADSRKGTIHIEASGHQYIEWISDGIVVYVGDVINLSDIPNIGSYVRANIYQTTDGPLAATQPFVIRRN